MKSIGTILKEARLARGLEIDDIAKRSCISARYLRAMEEGRFDIIPNVFDRGYLKIYTSLLQIDTASILARYAQLKKPARSQPISA